jgi:hypothetical protein
MNRKETLLEKQESSTGTERTEQKNYHVLQQ